MNKAYKLEKLEIQNFKIIPNVELIVIDFENNDLVVLDGPNGYGKTTVFDAIEILLTGKIKHLHDVDYHAPATRSNILANSDGKILINGYFKDSNDNILVIKRIINGSKFTGGVLTVDSEIYMTERKDDDAIELAFQNDINKIVGLLPSEDYYNTIYYVQQDDATAFFRQNESSRKVYIEKLLQTSESTYEKESLEKYKTLLKKKEKEISQKLEELKARTISDNSQNNTIIEFSRLIKWKELAWDNKEFIVDDTSFKMTLSELEAIKFFVINREDFSTYKNNETINNFISDGTEQYLSVQSMLKYYYFFENFDSIRNSFNKNQILHQFLEIFRTPTLDWQKIETFIIHNSAHLKTYMDTDKCLEQLRMQQSTQKNSDEISSIITHLEEIRNTLIADYNKFLNASSNTSETCPLCGFNYNTNGKKLLDAVKEKTIFFESYLNKQELDSKNEWQSYNQTILNEAFELITDAISKHEISKDFFKELNNAYVKKEKIAQTYLYLKSHNVAIDKLLNKDVDCNVYNLKCVESHDIVNKMLSELKKPLKNMEYSNENYANDNLVCQKYFDNNSDYNLSLESIENWIAYLNSCYRQYQINNRNQILTLTASFEKKTKWLATELSIVDGAISVYSKCLRTYYDKVIQVLQIPLYVFTGKIIQDYNCGLGLFIKTDVSGTNQIRLKFVKKGKDDHDIVNQFSAGQMAGVTLSFMLALNMVFSKDCFNTFLIDDPLQCMDDINMVSFVELLRNLQKATNKKIIISTHEDDVSRYFRYKFKNAGVLVQSYNVKDEFE